VNVFEKCKFFEDINIRFVSPIYEWIVLLCNFRRLGVRIGILSKVRSITWLANIW